MRLCVLLWARWVRQANDPAIAHRISPHVVADTYASMDRLKIIAW